MVEHYTRDLEASYIVYIYIALQGVHVHVHECVSCNFRPPPHAPPFPESGMLFYQCTRISKTIHNEFTWLLHASCTVELHLLHLFNGIS